jgi:hypothetical protein
MLSETDDNQPASSPVEKMLNALDEVEAAMGRLVAEKRTARWRITQAHLALGEPFSREELLALEQPNPRP